MIQGEGIFSEPPCGPGFRRFRQCDVMLSEGSGETMPFAALSSRRDPLPFGSRLTPSESPRSPPGGSEHMCLFVDVNDGLHTSLTSCSAQTSAEKEMPCGRVYILMGRIMHHCEDCGQCKPRGFHHRCIVFTTLKPRNYLHSWQMRSHIKLVNKRKYMNMFNLSWQIYDSQLPPTFHPNVRSYSSKSTFSRTC